MKFNELTDSNSILNTEIELFSKTQHFQNLLSAELEDEFYLGVNVYRYRSESLAFGVFSKSEKSDSSEVNLRSSIS
jgi:hypothetical protein